MSKRAPYNRPDRVANLIHRILADALVCELSDPRLSGVTVFRVNLTSDLGIARVHYIFSPHSKKREEEIEVALNKASGFLKKIIKQNIALKNMPKLEFFYASELDETEHIERLLKGETNVC